VSADLVTLTIDGKEVTVPKGTLIIRAAEQVGVEIPRFCDHPYLAPAGACRQCYVQIEGQPKLATSCTVTVAPGMIVSTQNTSDAAREAQVANLEFLLLNHPLDCPICDRGGECPLQDQALAFGPGESRFIEAKRVFPKPVPMSPLIALDRERCVLCARCTRFCDEISGDRFLELYARGAGERVSIAAGEDLRSPFSGNVIQICPVGALTSIPYRFVARPFDLTSADSVCRHCSAGCVVRVDQRRGDVVRVLAREHPEVNDAWICDKGRFAFRHDDLPTRITTPLVRDRGLEPASFGEALLQVADACRQARVGVLTGGRLMDEDAYALAKLARTVLGTNDLDHRRVPQPVEVDRRAALMATDRDRAVTYRDLERAPVIVVVGLDAEQEIPILHLRLRKAAARGARIVVVHPRETRLHDVGEHVLCRPGDETRLLAGGADATMDAALAALSQAEGRGVVIAGERPGAAAAAFGAAEANGARFVLATRRAGDRGTLVAGVHPALGPGGRRLDDSAERAELERVWGPVMSTGPGRASMDILRAAADHELDVLYLIGVDPLRDAPDAALARRALQNVDTVVAQSLELGNLEPYVTVFLPAASGFERPGHLTDWEGRGQRMWPLRPAAGISRPDWEIFAGLAAAAGGDLGFETLDELHEEMGRLLAPREATEEAAQAPEAQPADNGLTLVTYPLLIDDGRMVRDAPDLHEALGEPPVVEVNPRDAEAHGLADGLGVRVRTAAGEAVLPARVTDRIAAGAVFVPFNQPGFAANTVLAGAFTVSVELEAVESPDAPESSVAPAGDAEPATVAGESA
jgi:NADH-quinone oxidoreductase subunit G